MSSEFPRIRPATGQGTKAPPARTKADTLVVPFPRQAVLIGESALIRDAHTYFASSVRELTLRPIATDAEPIPDMPPGFPLQGSWCLICDLVTSYKSLRIARKILLNTSNIPFIALGNQPSDIPDPELRGILELGITHILPLPESWAEAWLQIRSVLVHRLNPLLSVHSTKMWLGGVLQSVATEERHSCIRISSRSHGKASSAKRDHGTSLRVSPVGLLGEIYMRDGQPVYAWSTRLQGDEAIIDLLQTSNVQISVFNSEWMPPAKNVQSSLQGVFLEFMRRKDLGQLEPPSAVIPTDELNEFDSSPGVPPSSKQVKLVVPRGSWTMRFRALWPIVLSLAALVLVTLLVILRRSPPPTADRSVVVLPPAAVKVSPALASHERPSPNPATEARSASPASDRTIPAPIVAPPRELAVELSENVRLEVVLIPAGGFRMGTPDDEPGRDHDEGPRHEVIFHAPFYMGKYEVTQEQYEAVMGQNPSQFKGLRKPVETVSSFEAQEFCERASRRAGREVRLPTEAEWEYACRAGSNSPFQTGAVLHASEANIDARSGSAASREESYRGKTLDVGSFPPNAFGLYDMHGNVGEWCLDFYDPLAYESSTSPAVPFSPTRPERVWRGGAYNDPPRRCRSGNREHYNPGGRDSFRGFRILTPCDSSLLQPERR